MNDKFDELAKGLVIRHAERDAEAMGLGLTGLALSSLGLAVAASDSGTVRPACRCFN